MPAGTHDDLDNDLEAQITEWRSYMRRRRVVYDADGDELEDHLRSTVDELVAAGLRPGEAFLVALKRMGSLDGLAREFAREHSDRLWKQLVLAGDPGAAANGESRRDLSVMIGCALAAAAAVKIPSLFGLDLEEDAAFYARNLSVLTLPPLAAYFAWRRRAGRAVLVVLALLFALGVAAANAYPFTDDAQSNLLTAIHLPLALWLVVGVAYAKGNWRSDRARMDYIRFTGEWFIYFVLIALGSMVLTLITVGVFDVIGIHLDTFAGQWLIPCGGAAAIVVAAWLVEAKQSVIENMAPVLTRVFTPLFTATMVAFLGAMAWTGNVIGVDRVVLIFFDLLLVVVLGLVLYSVSARRPGRQPGLFDRLQLALILSALVIDVLVLVPIVSRITEWGFTPNKTAALGENLILLANLGWTAWLLVAFLRHRQPFAHLERWQTRYVAVYAAWAWIVVLVFPPLFRFA